MRNLIPWRFRQKTTAPVRKNDWLDRWWEDPIDRLFPQFSNTFRNRFPSVDVSENGNEINVRAEIPGMTEKEIELSWHDGILNIRGEKKAVKEEEGQGRYYRECSYGSFYRDIHTGKNVDWKRAKAKYKHGVLSVALPKTASTAKRIEIQTD